MDYSTLLRLMKQRRSCRLYDARRPVPREAVEKCVEAARLAPSACNKQPWHFVVIDEPQVLTAMREQAKLPGLSHPWWESVPVFVAFCVRLDLLTHRVAPAFSGIPYYLLDMGIAGEHFVLAAESLGLGTCWIGWFKENVVRSILGVPRSVRIVSLLTLGWPAEQAQNSDAKSRKPAAEILSWNQW